jgi:hypothetical protein
MMVDHWKYVMLKTHMGGEMMFIFSPVMSHAYVASAFKHEVVSAGFVMQGNDGKMVCYGRSDSLRLASRHEEDSFYANLMLSPP